MKISRYMAGMPRQRLSKPACSPGQAVFTGFDAEDFWSVPGYQRNLPHWRLAGATYFVTFRLADSIPQEVVERWRREESQWLFERGIDVAWQRKEPDRFRQGLAKLDPVERACFERRTARQFFLELDQCHGCCALRQESAWMQVAQSLQHFHGQRLWVGDFVVMPNHVHVIAQPFDGVVLEEWLYSVKRFTAARLTKDESVKPLLKVRGGHVWQPESFDRVIRDLDELRRTRDYIRNNPKNLPGGEFCLHRAKWLDALV